MKIKKKLMIIMIIVMCMSNTLASVGNEEIGSLYALSACLMDGDTGRVLYEKDGYEVRANASTTKILTCVVAIENGNLEDMVTVSKYAASMPEVKMGIKEGEQYKLKDLLYAMMLESYNDVSVAIAEHIGGDVAGFANLMNEKLKDIGCYDTHFITPNGLDATEEIDGKEVIHGTTAVDLCRIMKYCKENEKFIEITQTKSYTLFDGTKQRSFEVYNRNAFLTMMDGVKTGKTGFTGDAGYCYVCALEQDGKEYIVALLGCGWPNNKTYKWSDTKKLMEYGLENYEYKEVFDKEIKLKKIKVLNGKNNKNVRNNIFEEVYVGSGIEENSLNIMLSERDKIEIKCNIKEIINAPVEKGQIVGTIDYYLNDVIMRKYPVYACETIEKINLKWVISNVTKKFFMVE